MMMATLPNFGKYPRMVGKLTKIGGQVNYTSALEEYVYNKSWWLFKRLIFILQIFFQVEHGTWNHGYAAVDNIIFNYGIDSAPDNCPTMPPNAVITTQPPSSTVPPANFPDCTFENGKCEWIVDNTSSMKWVRTDTKTLEDKGYDHPKADYDGMFMYVRAKNGHGNETFNDKTTLATPMMDSVVVGCLQFHFSIFVGPLFLEQL